MHQRVLGTALGLGVHPEFCINAMAHGVTGQSTLPIVSPVHASQYTIDTQLLMPLLQGAEALPC